MSKTRRNPLAWWRKDKHVGQLRREHRIKHELRRKRIRRRYLYHKPTQEPDYEL